MGAKIEIDIALKANYIQVDNISSSGAVLTPEIRQMFKSFWENYSENPISGRDVILVSFCPQLYGLYWVKLAIAVVLAGGSPLQDTTLTGIRTRAESHLLLVGDPGTGKSQLLRFASKIIPRAVLTTGVGSTAAGLTVSALKENGEWQLEAGALVMSDGGICFIDEFNSMREHDRTSIHEAMEQQTISVAKAGIVCKFNTRCSILAACNPKGNIDPLQPLNMSIALPSSLLSRFDLVLMLRDTVNEEWDGLVADYILNGGYNFSKLTSSKLWSTDILQAYFAIIKKLHPKLNEHAERILSSYYQMQRRVISRNKARTTVRSLESLVRLSQGHARLMYHETVEVIDSIYAIILIDAGMETDSPILNLNLNMNDIVPEKPLSNYRELLQIILEKLSLPDILEAELSRISKFKEKLKRSRFFQKSSNEENVNANETRNEQSNDGGYNTIVNQTNNFNNRKKGDQSSASSNAFESHVNPDKQNVEKAAPSHLHYPQTIDNKTQEVNTKKRTLGVEHNTSGMKRPKATSFNSNTENDEGYDTVSFNNLCSRDMSSKLEEAIGRSEEDVSEESVINNSSIDNNSELNISNKRNSLNQSETVVSKREPLKVELRNKRGKSPMEVNTKQKLSLKDKFKAFKFKNPQPEQNSTKSTSALLGNSPQKSMKALETNQISTAETSVNKQNCELLKHNQQSISNRVSLNPTSYVGKPSCSSSSSSKEVKMCSMDSITKTISFDSVQNDLDLLKLVPGINDDFDVDLNFDWDNFEEAGCLSPTMTSTQKSTFNNKPISINKFISKQSSSNNSISSSLIASLGSSTARSNVSIFEAADEELDFHI